MALFTEDEIRAKAKAYQKKSYTNKSARELIFDSVSQDNKYKSYDIFLSHSIRDAELILGIKAVLEELGYSVYVDWIDDYQLDRSRVSESTAAILRERMKRSSSLFYVTTENSTHSKWMPWECGKRSRPTLAR